MIHIVLDGFKKFLCAPPLLLVLFDIKGVPVCFMISIHSRVVHLSHLKEMSAIFSITTDINDILSNRYLSSYRLDRDFLLRAYIAACQPIPVKGSIHVALVEFCIYFAVGGCPMNCLWITFFVLVFLCSKMALAINGKKMLSINVAHFAQSQSSLKTCVQKSQDCATRKLKDSNTPTAKS